ncbi:MAG: tRNA(Ser) Um(44) 2'-O-methyltransferase [Alectoria fallacina]|uniref:tRNA (uracil-O(2)-)-methyltransferase n=1 Tax=Alectoria fallacina TaxID=1903189 RepID=A0A8H3PE08_9LECA|nr:MAG: tRNA(Ser) Um(44) 2'-O-methyltransferase [Alectoria fallacina]
MPTKILKTDDLTESTEVHPPQRLPNEAWLPVLQHSCEFPPDVFESVSINLLKNPNINSSLLFRADILYDSQDNELADAPLSEQEINQVHHWLEEYRVRDGEFPGFEVKRTIIRRMIPRNPQLDKPIAQTCLMLQSIGNPESVKRSLVIYMPHAASIDEVPWYHPRVQSLAYLHCWIPTATSEESQGTVSLHYRLYPSESFPLSSRLLRTGRHLLMTIHKHGQGQLTGYTKRVHHDQIVSQQRVQNTYTELKQRHAQRLCDHWVEKTEPSKHVFEDLGIAAFLIELWKDMYDTKEDLVDQDRDGHTQKRGAFPGFVDIGCGNGVLVDTLLREGYSGWGFDARRRKTWDTFDSSVQDQLKEMILVPQPLFELQHDSMYPTYANGGILSEGLFSAATTDKPVGDLPAWHNGLFPQGTFIISNHADELTPWTPLLASISSSPFLAIPCCSHNLSGLRFRAPSVFNNNSADALAPSYFAAHINRSKSIAIAIACPDNEEIFGQGPEQGDLNDFNGKARAKQPSAYSSLCDWVAHLAARLGYEVEREMLRMPSTRNVGIVGRAMMLEFREEGLSTRRGRVREIVMKEKADGVQWVERARSLMSGKGSGH